MEMTHGQTGSGRIGSRAITTNRVVFASWFAIPVHKASSP